MPLFSNRFSHKKSPSRKSKPLSSLHRELSQSYDYNYNNETIKLELDNQLINFDTTTGQWITSGSKDQSLIERIKDLESSHQTLEQENRLLKLKIEILLQMVTEATAELKL